MTDDKLREALGELPIVKCPPTLAQRLAAIPDEPRRRTTVRWWAWATPLAAAAALATVLIATRPAPAPHYTDAEVADARMQAVETVSTAMALIQRTQREAVSEVLGRQVPNTLRTSVQKALQLSEGGQG
jgi:hypothetical protein